MTTMRDSTNRKVPGRWPNLLYLNASFVAGWAIGVFPGRAAFGWDGTTTTWTALAGIIVGGLAYLSWLWRRTA